MAETETRPFTIDFGPPGSLVQGLGDFDFMSPWEGVKHVLPGDEKAREG